MSSSSSNSSSFSPKKQTIVPLYGKYLSDECIRFSNFLVKQKAVIGGVSYTDVDTLSSFLSVKLFGMSPAGESGVFKFSPVKPRAKPRSKEEIEKAKSEKSSAEKKGSPVKEKFENRCLIPVTRKDGKVTPCDKAAYQNNEIGFTSEGVVGYLCCNHKKSAEKKNWGVPTKRQIAIFLNSQKKSRGSKNEDGDDDKDEDYVYESDDE